MFSSVRTPRVYEHIVEQIERAIFDGRLRSGDRLPPERELVRQFRASRVAVREALRTLEHRGLIEVRHGASGGHFVREMDTTLLRRDVATLLRLGRVSVAQLTEARLLIEPETARLAALRASEEDVKTLRGALEERAARVGSGERPRELDLGFHRLVADAAKNPVHSALTDALIGLEADLTIGGGPLTAADHAEVGAAHEQIYAAIAARRADQARDVMAAHILDLQHRLARVESSAGRP